MHKSAIREKLQELLGLIGDDDDSPMAKYETTGEETGKKAFNDSGAGITDVAGQKEKPPPDSKTRTMKMMSAMLSGKLKGKK